MRINTVSARPQVETSRWNAPSGEDLATIYTDTYKLGLLALRLLSGDHDTTNPQHLPATTPTQLRQIITDTLTNQPHQRPLPEAWTYVLGHAIEQAHHQKKTTPPVSAPPAAPPTPIVRSRPPVHSAPPVRPSTPPVPPPRPADRPPVPALHPAERPPVPPLRPAESSPAEIGTPPPPSEQGPRRSLTWLIAAIVVVLAAAGITGYLAINGHRHAASRPSQTVLPFTGPNWPRHQPLPPRRPPPPVRRAAIFPENGNPATTNVQRA